MYLPEEELKSKLLNKQIRKYLDFVDKNDYEKFRYFLGAIDEAYEDENERLELSERSLEISTEELNNKNEQLSKILDKNLEVTKRLEGSKKNLELIVNNLWEWLMVIDNKGKIVISNVGASSITWYSNKYLLNKNYKEIIRFVDEKNKLLDDFIRVSIDEEKEYSSSRNIFLWLENISVPISVVVTPLKNFTSKWTACVIVFKDVTEEKRLENLKNEFLSIASHELRTPMTVIRWYTSLFIRWKLWVINENQKMYLEKIFSNTVGLINMVNDMLDLNKLEAGKMTFSYDKINIKDVVENSIDDMKDLLNQKWVLIESDLSDIISISDKDKIKQVVVNFLSNAYKFTDKGWKISVKLELEKDIINLSVKDSWIWIRNEDIWKLFKKFSQVWSYLNKTEKWTWLWLSLCKQIVEEMWWTIYVNSEYWKWSTFWFTLQLKEK